MIKNLLFIMSMVFIAAISSYSQTQIPDYSNEILITDNAGSQKLLVFGLDSIATDGIDVPLEESDLPPFPPVGAFEARFFLPDNNFAGTLGSYRDFRNATLPFTGQKEFRLAYQPGTGTEIIVYWNFPPNVTGVLQDIIIGTLINVPMIDSGSYTVTNPSAFNRLKMLINYQGVIPVELISFAGFVNGNDVTLNWQTATEVNNSGFQIERLTIQDEKTENWESIGFVSGKGTTTEIQKYTFTDRIVSTGNYQYRLKQIDFDGTFDYSKVLTINLSAPDEYILNQNYPNPFNPSTSISFSLPQASNVKLTIYNQLGERVDQLVNNYLEVGLYNIQWNASHLASGVYFYELQTADYYAIQKMSLIK